MVPFVSFLCDCLVVWGPYSCAGSSSSSTVAVLVLLNDLSCCFDCSDTLQISIAFLRVRLAMCSTHSLVLHSDAADYPDTDESIF